MKRVLADLRKGPSAVELWLDTRPIDLSKLTEAQRAAVQRASLTLAMEVDVVEQNGALQAVSLGDTRAHPRTAALRAVEDLRFHQAREAFEQLGDRVERDVELLTARLSMHGRTNQAELAEQDFSTLLNLPTLTFEQARAAYSGLFSGAVQQRCAGAFASWGERWAAKGGEGVSVLVTLLPADVPSEALLVAGLEELVRERASLAELEELVTRLKSRGATSAAAWSAQLDVLRAKEAEKEARRQKKRFLNRPDLAEIEKHFGVRLPAALRAEWEAHFSHPSGDLFFLALKPELLVKLAKDVEAELLDTKQPARRVLPFAEGEHEGDVFALDLDAAVGDDFAVRLMMNLGGGDDLAAYPTSAAWLSARGAPKYT